MGVLSFDWLHDPDVSHVNKALAYCAALHFYLTLIFTILGTTDKSCTQRNLAALQLLCDARILC